MKVFSIRSLALFAALLLGAMGCDKAASPTSAIDAPTMTGSSSDGLLNVNPLFRSVGPRFELSGLTHQSDGLLMAAADANDGAVHAARRTRTLYNDETVTAKVDPAAGATIKLKRAGMRVVIPAGALPGVEVMNITVQAYAGKYHVYEFLPHGIEFNQPIRVEFDIVNVEAFGEELKRRLARLSKYTVELARCEQQRASEADLSDTCEKLFSVFADLKEDENWYVAAVSSDGFVGVYFAGYVHGSSDLEALEVFDVNQTGDELTFQTTHFSGYALGM